MWSGWGLFVQGGGGRFGGARTGREPKCEGIWRTGFDRRLTAVCHRYIRQKRGLKIRANDWQAGGGERGRGGEEEESKSFLCPLLFRAGSRSSSKAAAAHLIFEQKKEKEMCVKFLSRYIFFLRKRESRKVLPLLQSAIPPFRRNPFFCHQSMSMKKRSAATVSE